MSTRRNLHDISCKNTIFLVRALFVPSYLPQLFSKSQVVCYSLFYLNDIRSMLSIENVERIAHACHLNKI